MNHIWKYPKSYQSKRSDNIHDDWTKHVASRVLTQFLWFTPGDSLKAALSHPFK